jgi:transposase
MGHKNLSVGKREAIIALKKSNVSVADIVRDQDVSRSTVYKTIRRLEVTGSPNPVKRCGRPPSLASERAKRALKRLVERHRWSTKAEVRSEVQRYFYTRLSLRTLNKKIKSIGFYSRYAARKPLLSKKNIVARLKWARAHRTWTAEDFSTVVFTDESRFCLVNDDRRVRVWRQKGTRHDAKNVVGTLQGGGGGVMVWGAMSAFGVGPLVVIEGSMDSDKYVNLLSNHFHPWFTEFRRMHPSALFQHDHATCHTSQYTSWWLRTHNFPSLKWFGKGADCSPIENLWDHLERQIRKPEAKFKNVGELTEALQKAWSEIPAEVCANLAASVPRRLKAIMKAKGNMTKY